jgi:hypothetical protein
VRKRIRVEKHRPYLTLASRPIFISAMALTPDERRRAIEDGVAIIEELDAAIPMIRSGLESLVQTPNRPRNLDVAMQSLAPGFERLLAHLHPCRGASPRRATGLAGAQGS